MKKLHTRYSFAKGASGAGTVTLKGLNVPLERILLITNAAANTIIYNFADAAKGQSGYSQGADSVLTLAMDTSAMSNSDELTIHYDDGSPNLSVDFADIAQDSFGRLRTSNPGQRFDAQLTYQINSDAWDQSGTNHTITHSATERWAALTCGTASGDKAILQSHYHSPYTPGRGQLAFITFKAETTPAPNGYVRVGYYDGTNGIYLERLSTGNNLVLKSSTSKGTETVAQADWNIDPMDGSGPSGRTLNLANVQILVIQLQALYVGRVVVGFDIDGKVVPVHQFLCANEEAFPYIAQASLPVRYEVGCSGASGAAPVLKAICASVMSEGGANLDEMFGRAFSASNGTTSIGVTTRAPILSIRPTSTINSVPQHAVAIPLSCEVLAKTNDAFVEIVRNGTLSGSPSFAAVDSALSGMTKDVAASGISGGQVIDSFFVVASASSRNMTGRDLAGRGLLCYSHLLGSGDTLSVVVTALSGTTNVNAALKWKELR